MPSCHLILCHPLLLLSPIPPRFRAFSNESTLRMRWPKYWSFSFSIIPSKEIPGLISFRMDWKLPNCYPKWLPHFTLLPADIKVSISLHSHQYLLLYIFFKKLHSKENSLKIKIINMLMAVTKKVDSMQEQMGDVSNKFKRLETL